MELNLNESKNTLLLLFLRQKEQIKVQMFRSLQTPAPTSVSCLNTVRRCELNH